MENETKNTKISGNTTSTPPPGKIIIPTQATSGTTPGNVGVCFSGGGSIAMISAMGQLRALNNLKMPKDDTPLLSKVRAISTVSGGSWATVPFMYLPDSITDADFLGSYLDNPEQVAQSNLYSSPSNSLGSVATSNNFSALSLMRDTVILLTIGYPTNHIWSNLIGKHVLKPLGLAEMKSYTIEVLGKKIEIPGFALAPSWFARSQADVKAIKANASNAKNSALSTPVYLYQLSPSRATRPFHLCNTSMFVYPQGSTSDDLVPVQCTAYETGIYANKGCYVKASGEKDNVAVGGGLVPSFAFDSALSSLTGTAFEAELLPEKLFSLSDITGNSSAFFATILPHLISENVTALTESVDQLIDGLPLLAIVKDFLRNKANEIIDNIADGAQKITLDPEYEYWSPISGTATQTAKFADGGSIENNGLCNLLANQDIDGAVVFVNALKAVDADPSPEYPNPDTLKECRATDKSDHFITTIIDTWLPPLFGYTPYQEKGSDFGAKYGSGYYSYSDLKDRGIDISNEMFRFFEHNKIFESALFSEFVTQLGITVTSKYKKPGVYYNDKIEVLNNDWFNIQNGGTDRYIKLLVVHYGPLQSWTDAINDFWSKNEKKKHKYKKFKKELHDFIEDNKKKIQTKNRENVATDGMFPNFIITETHMDPLPMNLLAHLTSYVCSQQMKHFKEMFS